MSVTENDMIFVKPASVPITDATASGGAANCLGVGSTFYIFGYPKV